MSAFFGGCLNYAEEEGSKTVVSATIRCYQCSCAIIPLGHEQPTKFVNDITLKASPNFLKVLREKEQYYKMAFGIIPNEEKHQVFLTLLRDYYTSAIGHTEVAKTANSDTFMSCFLRVCSKKQSRRLVRYHGWTPDQLKDFRTLQLYSVGGSGFGSASEGFMITHIACKKTPLKSHKMMIRLIHNAKVFSRHYINLSDFYPDPGLWLNSLVTQQLKYYGTSTPDPIEVLSISRKGDEFVVDIGICGVVHA